MTERTKGNLMLLFTAMIWGSGFIAQKVGMEHVGPYAFNGIRQMLACIILMPATVRAAKMTNYFDAGVNGMDEVRDRRHRMLRASLVCGILLAIGTNSQQVGLSMIPASKAGFITAIYIVLVPILGLFFGQKVSARTWCCVAAAVAGFGLLSLKDGDFSAVETGDLIALSGALFFAMQIIAVNRFVTQNNAVILSAAQMLVSGVLTIICMVIFEDTSMRQVLAAALPLLYSAVVPTAIGYTLQIMGQKSTDPTVAALLLSLESVFSAVFGVLLLGESMTAQEWAGCAVIFAANIVSQIPSREDREAALAAGTEEKDG
jgi:drug/metabolite transporter (DMT)-like permease